MKVERIMFWLCLLLAVACAGLVVVFIVGGVRPLTIATMGLNTLTFTVLTLSARVRIRTAQMLKEFK